MDENFRLNRHTVLWEEYNLRIKRMIMASMALGVLILVNVLRPYAQDLDKTRDIRAEVQAYEENRALLENSVSAMNDLHAVLEDIQATIDEQPWMSEKDALVDTLAEIRNRGEGSWPRYQEEADKTIRTIGLQVEDMVVKPLNEYFAREPQLAELMPDLYGKLKTLPSAIEHWVTANQGKRWYRTLDSKQREVEHLSDSLARSLGRLFSIIKREKLKVTQKIDELNREIQRLEAETDIKAKEALLEILEMRLEEILPEWIRGMISVHQMVQVYPICIIAAVIYIIILTVSLQRHFNAIAGLRNITAEEKSDPVFSSLWTLTYRGIRGTLFTVLSYLGFTAAMWLMFEAGSDVFLKWLAEEKAGFLDESHLLIILWAGRIIFSMAICFFVISPFLNKRYPVRKEPI